MTGKVVPLRSEPAEGTAVLGLSIYCGVWAMTLGSLALTYAFLRGRGEAVSVHTLGQLQAVSWGGSLALGGVWVAMARMKSALLRGRPSPSVSLAWFAVLLPATALVLELGLLWALGMARSRGEVSPAVAAALGILAFHALHVGIGAGGLWSVLWRWSRGRLGPGRMLPARLWSIYWSFMACGWWGLTPLWGLS